MYCIACGAQNSDQDKFCSRCGKPLVTGAGAQVAAAAFAAAPAVPAMPAVAFRQGNRLVVPKGAPLPPYCVKCGQPVTGELYKKTYYWHTPWLWLLAMLGLLGFIAWHWLVAMLGLLGFIALAIVSMAIRKRADLAIALCDEHRQRRKSLLIATWVLALGFIPAGILVGSLISDTDAAVGLGILTGLLLFVAAIVTGVKSAVLRPTEITEFFGTFSGAGEQFLTKLPSR